jgi:hypothetical protein
MGPTVTIAFSAVQQSLSTVILKLVIPISSIVQKLDKPTTFTTLLAICLVYFAKSVSASGSHHQTNIQS